jgi:energy-converting hydrogenase Eha subunit F
VRAAFVFLIPALFFGLLFGVFLPESHPSASTPHPVPFSCQSEMASLAPLDAGGQIAPLCGQAAYPKGTP